MYYNNDQEHTETFHRPPVSGEYHFSASQTGGSSADGAPKPGFFQRRKANQGAKPPKPPRSKKKNSPISTSGVVAIALACALVGGGVGGGIAYFAGNSSGGGTNIAISDRSSSGGADVTATKVKAGDTMTSSQVYAKYGDCVVSVNVKTSEGEGAGTGFLISEDGYILTCNHVVSGTTAISVVRTDSTSYEAELVGSDEDLDVAVLKIKDAGEAKFPYVVLGDSEDLTVGDSVTAIGNALGTLANTLTTGVVSALDRAISMSDGAAMSLLQTDCTVNSGNSGGPLFNQYGEVIGIVNAKYSSSSSMYSSEASIEGIGFAIPIDDVLAMVKDIMTNGYVTNKAYIGITPQTMNAQIAQQFRYDVTQGVFVCSVEEGSAAEKAGLRMGDVITKIDDKAITSYEDLVAVKKGYSAGDTATFTIYREGKTQTVELTFDAAPQTQETAQDNSQQQQGGSNGGYYYNPWDFFNSFFGNGYYGSSYSGESRDAA